jgi:hypothetical protein
MASELEQRFQALVVQWKEETQYHSSLHIITEHPAYQEIIGMGVEALPLILKELERENDHWFWALTQIANTIGEQDPVKKEDWGYLEKMRDTWLQWGRERNLI